MKHDIVRSSFEAYATCILVFDLFLCIVLCLSVCLSVFQSVSKMKVFITKYKKNITTHITSVTQLIIFTHLIMMFSIMIMFPLTLKQKVATSRNMPNGIQFFRTLQNWQLSAFQFLIFKTLLIASC